MWYIMHSYYYVMKWHKEEEKIVPKLDSLPTIADIENDYNKKYVLKKLDTGFTRVWQVFLSHLQLFKVFKFKTLYLYK